MRILLIEDNEKLRALVNERLVAAGFDVDSTGLAEEALALLQSLSYGLVILDLGLPDEDGIQLLRQIRRQKNTVSVLILTARDTLDEKIKGLNAGADDYMTKPFAVEELIARIHALLRRPSQGYDVRMELGNISYDPQARQVHAGGDTLRLSRRELSLLDIMIRANGHVVPKERIEQQLYSYGEEGSANSVEVLVHRLRKKLIDQKAGVEIHTLRGIGYMMTGAQGG